MEMPLVAYSKSLLCSIASVGCKVSSASSVPEVQLPYHVVVLEMLAINAVASAGFIGLSGDENRGLVQGTFSLTGFRAI
ncbi:hypothetical protein C5167_042180 [Papaver somniferum]|uniref:Uncharacterized protein n=1 Tax=Papaver somniferum TaxID=3469 RepID=A0A4Y7L228_PAPSO|nr:hypothetical protein C5167_042180 [Papaver somniferum]